LDAVRGDNQSNESPAQPIETDRLLLRPFDLGDVERLARLNSEPSFWHFPLRRTLAYDETEAFIERTIARYETDGVGLWAAVEKTSDALAGLMGLSVPHYLPEVLPAVEVGWRLGRRYWGLGLATEGGAASVSWGFDNLHVDEILAVFESANRASRSVAERLGFAFRSTATHPKFGFGLEVWVVSRKQWRGTDSAIA
jgi:RimJ/RimL family protein N-acetyltransferase